MTKKTKALIYNFLSFIAFLLPLLVLVQSFTYLTGIWIPATDCCGCNPDSPKISGNTDPAGRSAFREVAFYKRSEGTEIKIISSF
ncbi:MAG: hypothetical protein QM710_00105 [Flavobacterium sp.]